jgi:hypothetical protein
MGIEYLWAWEVEYRWGFEWDWAVIVVTELEEEAYEDCTGRSESAERWGLT